MALEKSPVILQAPDFGNRFWVCQVVDIRTDAFAQIGVMYDSKPGFYMLVGPNWKGDISKGIEKVFRYKTNTAFVVPRVFMSDDPQDLVDVQKLIEGINVYPLQKVERHLHPRLRPERRDDKRNMDSSGCCESKIN